MSLAAIYFTAMYVFHSGLNGAPPQHDREPQPVRRWDAGGADGNSQLQQPERRRLPVERIDSDRQDVFDNIRQGDQRRERGDEPRADAVHDDGPGPEPDVNVPASCNASAVERRRRGDDFLPLGSIYLLSAFWDERPNDFDNRQNRTLIRMMAVVRGTQQVTLACDFGLRRTAVSYYEMCENHHRPFGSFILSCPVPDDVVEVPCFVAVVMQSMSGSGDNRVDVPLRTLRPHTVSHSFSVCVSPLYGDVSPAKLVEFFEVRGILSLILRILPNARI